MADKSQVQRLNQLKIDFEQRLHTIDNEVRGMLNNALNVKVDLSNEYILYLTTKSNIEIRLFLIQGYFVDLDIKNADDILAWLSVQSRHLRDLKFKEYSLRSVIDTLSRALEELKVLSNSVFLLSNRANRELIEEIDKMRIKSQQDAAIINDLKGRMEVELKEFDEKYQSKLGDYEILSQERIFREEAQQNKKDSRYWSYIIGGLAVVLIIVSWNFMRSCWFNYSCMCQKIEKACFITGSNIQFLFYYELIRPVLIRVFILSIIVLLLKFAIKNYNAIMHNSTINMNKANSLAALIRIIAGLPNDDKDSKNIILTSASKEIFLQHKTGYLSKDDAKVNLGLIEKIISIFKK